MVQLRKLLSEDRTLDAPPAPEARADDRSSGYWPAFAVGLILIAFLFVSQIYSPAQDHFASIPLAGDDNWYVNYAHNTVKVRFGVPDVGIQDPEIFFHGIGHSIANAQQADIIFIGSSRLLFALDWREFEEFEIERRVKMFNMGFAGIADGGFSLLLKKKFGLAPKLWVINADNDLRRGTTSFFHITTSQQETINETKARAFRRVVARNILWRAGLTAGIYDAYTHRSAKTGNWQLEHWPGYTSKHNPAFKLMNLTLDLQKGFYWSPYNPVCPVTTEEVYDARSYLKAIGGAVVLVQVPGNHACPQRVHELAVALGVPAFIVDATKFTTVDSGHADGAGAHKYSAMLFAWLKQQPQFKRLFAK
jgi:hypothetical protein